MRARAREIERLTPSQSVLPSAPLNWSRSQVPPTHLSSEKVEVVKSLPRFLALVAFAGSCCGGAGSGACGEREGGRERAWGETGAGGQFQELMCVPRRGEARGGGIRRGRGNVSLTFPRAFSPARVPPVERGEGFLSCARGKLRARQSFGSRERARVRARGRLESIGEWIGC